MSDLPNNLDSQLSFSTTLACEIGLEEAILLQTLAELAYLFASNQATHAAHNSPLSEGREDNYRIPGNALIRKLRFWQLADIQRLVSRLCNLKKIYQISPPLGQVDYLAFSFIKQAQRPSSLDSYTQSLEPQRQALKPHTHSAIRPVPLTLSNRALPISLNWRPNEQLRRDIARMGIDLNTLESATASFVRYYREKGAIGFSWGNKFKDWIKRTQTFTEANNNPDRITAQTSASSTTLSSFEQHIVEPTPMTPDWRPNTDAFDILLRDGINPEFIKQAIAEFTLYWHERGEVHKTWNSIFVARVQRQWLRHQTESQFNRDPTPIPSDWQPDDSVFDILKMTDIDQTFARKKIQEFVLYWRDSGKVYPSWNSKFLEFIRHKWNQHLEHYDKTGRLPSSSHSSAANAQAQLTDTSWAE